MTPGDPEYERLKRENTNLAHQIEELKSRVLTEAEVACLREVKLERERSAWAWSQIRTYAPWIVAITSAASSAIYWLVTHISFKAPGP